MTLQSTEEGNVTPRPTPESRTDRGMRYTVAAFCAITLAILAPGIAQTHTLPHPKHMTIEQRRDFQQRVLWHDRSVERFFRLHPSKARTLAGRRSRAWHRAQARWTRRELGETFSALDRLLVPHRAAWQCIHGYEGDWEDGAAPFWGGLQMDWSFLHTYGPDFIRIHGEPRGVAGANGWANAWSETEQMIAAERAHRTRGFYPWPNTARKCGLL